MDMKREFNWQDEEQHILDQHQTTHNKLQKTFNFAD